MVAHVTTFRLKPGAMDDLIRAFQDSLALTAAEQPGFGGLTLLTCLRSDKAIMIGLWTTEADLLAGESSGYEQGQLDVLLVRPAAREVYDVSVQVELAASGTARISGI